MWEIALPALIGVGSSLLVLGLPRLLDGHSKQLHLRQSWVQTFLDSDVLQELDVMWREDSSDREKFGLLARIPAPTTEHLVQSRGALTEARKAALRQVADLYDQRIEENSEGRLFSASFDDDMQAFKTRLIRWSHGRLPVSRVYVRRK